MRKCVVEKLAMLGDRSLLELFIQDIEYFDKEWVKSHNGWFAFFPIKIKFASTLLELQVWRSFTRSHQRPKQFLQAKSQSGVHHKRPKKPGASPSFYRCRRECNAQLLKCRIKSDCLCCSCCLCCLGCICDSSLKECAEEKASRISAGGSSLDENQKTKVA